MSIPVTLDSALQEGAALASITQGPSGDSIMSTPV